MDFNSSTKKKDARTQFFCQSKTSVKPTGAENKQDKHNTTLKTLSKRLSPEKINKLERQRQYVLINEHNRLKLAVKEKETKLKELQKSLKEMKLQTINDTIEDTLNQRVRQLENDREKMKMKITGAKKIQMAYQLIYEHLQKEVCCMYQTLDLKERAVALGTVEVNKAQKRLQSAEAATASALSKLAQMKKETMEKRREMNSECELNSQMETIGGLAGQSRLKGQEFEKEAHSVPVSDHHPYDICGASESEMKLVEDMEALRKALGCATVQDLVHKVVLQRTTKMKLLNEISRYEELIEEKKKTLCDLELQYDVLRFSERPAATRCGKTKEQIQTKLDMTLNRVEQLQAKLKQGQDLLETVEQGVSNIYFRMSCVSVEGLPSIPRTDSLDKLRDISARLPTLLQRASKQKPEISGLDQENFLSLLDKFNTMDSRNSKRSTAPDTPRQSDEEEEDYSLSREEMKQSSLKLIESQQRKQ